MSRTSLRHVLVVAVLSGGAGTWTASPVTAATPHSPVVACPSSALVAACPPSLLGPSHGGVRPEGLVAHGPAVPFGADPGHGGLQPSVRVTNYVPAFLAFHREAAQVEEELRQEALERESEPDAAALSRARLEAWERHLGDAAPRLARGGGGGWEPENLDGAWDRYPGAMERIRAAVDGITPSPQGVFEEVASRLRLDRPLAVDLFLYVGTFQEQAAFRLVDGEYAILLPVETLPQARRPLFIDLFTRAVHARLSGRPAGGNLSLAQHLFLRGLGLRVFEDATPGRPAETYLQRSRDWLLSAERRDREILEGMRVRLGERDPQALARFLEGPGGGAHGDFDYAAWRISGLLLMDGWSLDRLARIPVDEVEGVVSEILGLL
jgi:hypothetical protein